MSSATDPLSVRERLLAATYACIARFGMAKTTVEDVVKESGISRATIYRHFEGGRDELLRETVAWEVGHFLVGLADHVRDAQDLRGMLTEGLQFAARAVRSHDLLQKMLATEPDRLLGLLTTEGAATMPFVADFLRPYLAREQAQGRTVPGVDLDAAAEYLARSILSLIAAPGRFDLEDPAAVADLVGREMLGGIVRS